jgi:transposase
MDAMGSERRCTHDGQNERDVVLGRKNHQGSRSERGIYVTGALYSLIESAKLSGLEPRAYLKTAVEYHLRGDVVPLPHELR